MSKGVIDHHQTGRWRWGHENDNPPIRAGSPGSLTREFAAVRVRPIIAADPI